MDVLVADLREGDALIEQTPFQVVKAVIPGLVPIAFGWGLEPLGLPRLRKVPTVCGLRRTELALDQLNRFPHPFV
jgi:ribosomal protein S12 methylthiotransferase accessory factor